jgi:hypothetical protein
MKKSVFKVGDKVFDIRFGWGIVKVIDESDLYAINVYFDGYSDDYTWDGRAFLGLSKVLSFTEYTLEGFTQERPEELPKKGQIVWVRDDLDEEWRVAHFLGIIGRFYKASICFLDQTPPSWNYITTENPYKDEEASI